MLKEALEAAGMKVGLEDVSPSVDVTFAGNTHEHQYLLKLRPDDFERADAVLEEQAQISADSLSADHYFRDFSDEELFELLEKYDEWSKEDQILAVRLLRERGRALSDEDVAEIKAERLASLRRPEVGKPCAVTIGFAAALAGGIIGLLMGWTFWKSTKTDPTGRRYPLYDDPTRRRGRLIFWISAVTSAIFVGLFFRNLG